MKRTFHIIKRALLYILYFAVMFLIAEGFLRLFWTEPPMTYIVPGNSDTYHHVPRFLEKKGLGRYDFRGREYVPQKQPNTLRVVFMGDSFTYGIVSQKQTIPYWFQTLMEVYHPDTTIEVLNFGYPSYSALIHEVQYRRLIEPLHADLIVYLYDACDPIDDAIYKRFADFDATGRPLAVHDAEYFKKGLRRSILVRFLQFAASYIENRGYRLPDEEMLVHRSQFLRDPQANDKYRDWLDYSQKRLSTLAKDIQNDGTRFVLFQYPWPFHLKDPSEFQEFIAGWGAPDWTSPEHNRFAELTLAFCERQRLECYDFYPIVRQMEDALEGGSRLKLYNNKDAHFTGYSNRRFAEFILSKLKPFLSSPEKSKEDESAR